jgi:hypothetical protein
MTPIALILLCFAFVFFVIAVTQLGQPHWQKLIAAGLAFWVATEIFFGALKVFTGH